MEKEFWRWTEAEDFTGQTSITSGLFVIWLLGGLSLTNCVKEDFVHYEFVLVAYVLKFRDALVKVFTPSEYIIGIAMLSPFVARVCLRFQNFQ